MHHDLCSMRGCTPVACERRTVATTEPTQQVAPIAYWTVWEWVDRQSPGEVPSHL